MVNLVLSVAGEPTKVDTQAKDNQADAGIIHKMHARMGMKRQHVVTIMSKAKRSDVSPWLTSLPQTLSGATPHAVVEYHGMMKGHTITHSENIARLSRVEGQIKGVKRMIEEGEYCIDIITQIQAARAALQSVSKIILEKHLKHCVADALEAKNEAETEQKLEEIMTVIKRMEK